MTDCTDPAACDPGTPAPLPDAIAEEELARMFKALGHPARVKILRYLIAHNSCFFGDLSALLPLSPSTVSQHMSVLKEAGLVIGTADEQRVCYCFDPQRLTLLKRWVELL